jgi:hypothetical protein
MNRKLKAIQTENTKSLSEMTMEEIIGRPINKPVGLKPPVFKEALVSFESGNILNRVLSDLTLEDEQRSRI